MKKLFLVFLVLIVFTSCMTTKTNIGNYKQTVGTEYTFDKAKQVYIFWGLVPIGRANAETPQDGNCQVMTKFTFGDFCINVVTLGVVKTYTIKVKAKK